MTKNKEEKNGPITTLQNIMLSIGKKSCKSWTIRPTNSNLEEQVLIVELQSVAHMSLYTNCQSSLPIKEGDNLTTSADQVAIVSVYTQLWWSNKGNVSIKVAR